MRDADGSGIMPLGLRKACLSTFEIYTAKKTRAKRLEATLGGLGHFTAVVVKERKVDQDITEFSTVHIQ